MDMISLSKIRLLEEKETLFITLYVKALDYRSKHSVSVFKSPLIKNLSLGSRILYGFMSLVPKFKDMICLLRYEF